MKKKILFVLISVISISLVFSFALMLGSYNISIRKFFISIFTNDESVNLERRIILYLRLPRTCLALLTGISLSLSGILYQEVFRNDLVSPDLLGVSNGASVGASVAIIIGLSSILISLFSFILGIVTVLLTILISKIFRNKNQLILVLSGIIVSGFMSSLLSIIKYIANPDTTLSTITFWLMGSFSDATMNQVYIFAPIVLLSLFIVLPICWKINIVALGREEAITKGINYNLYKYLIIGISTLLTAISVSFCGTISWIGLVIPHISMLIVGKDTRKSIPLSIIFGANFMMIVDILSRTFTSSDIPLSAITGIIGSVIFVIILLRNRGNRYEN